MYGYLSVERETVYHAKILEIQNLCRKSRNIEQQYIYATQNDGNPSPVASDASAAAAVVETTITAAAALTTTATVTETATVTVGCQVVT